MSLNSLKARLGSISPRRLACLVESQPVVAKILEDVRILIMIAEYAESMIYEDGVIEHLVHLNVFHGLAESLEELDNRP